jgi:integrase
VLSAALKFAYRHGWITVSPYVPRVKEVPRVHWMRPETAQWLLEAAKPVRHLYAYILISLHSGQRKDAVLGLTWDRVDWESNVIRFTDPHLVCAHRRKNRATVPISATLRELLLELREEAGTSPYVINYAGTRLQDIRHAWRKAIKAAEISGKHTPHGLRHSVATNLLRSGRTLLEVSKLLGHRDSSITERVYGHFEPDFVQDSVNQLDHLFGAQQL